MPHGIKETKELLKFIIELTEAIDKSLEDGEIGFGDISTLVTAMKDAGPAFSDMKLIPEELKDLDDTEALELYTYAKDELELSGKKTEEIVEASLEIGLKMFELVNLIKSEVPEEAPAEKSEEEFKVKATII